MPADLACVFGLRPVQKFRAMPFLGSAERVRLLESPVPNAGAVFEISGWVHGSFDP